MEESYNVDPNSSKDPKTSSSDGKSNSKTTGDSQVQDGKGVVEHEVERPYEKGDDQQEYIEQANNNTEVANESPVQNGKGMTMLTSTLMSDADDDDSDDDDSDDDDPFTEIEIGDDPDDTKKKIPVM
jgi:hypothetical protein